MVHVPLAFSSIMGIISAISGYIYEMKGLVWNGFRLGTWGVPYLSGDIYKLYIMTNMSLILINVSILLAHIEVILWRLGTHFYRL